MVARSGVGIYEPIITEEAYASIKAAGEEVVHLHVEDPLLSKPTADGMMGTTVTCDGTWHKRGFTSLHGVVVVVLDSNILVVRLTPSAAPPLPVHDVFVPLLQRLYFISALLIRAVISWLPQLLLVLAEWYLASNGTQQLRLNPTLAPGIQ